VVGGVITTQYVDVHVFSLLVPGLLGLAAGWLTAAAARTGLVASAVAVVSAVLGTALGVRLQTGGGSLLHPVGDVGPPYLCSIAGALAWRLVGAPRRHSADRDLDVVADLLGTRTARSGDVDDNVGGIERKNEQR
jgi:hypothetical protein